MEITSRSAHNLIRQVSATVFSFDKQGGKSVRQGGNAITVPVIQAKLLCRNPAESHWVNSFFRPVEPRFRSTGNVKVSVFRSLYKLWGYVGFA